MHNLPFAENMNYWKTSQSSPDKWTENAKKLIADVGGRLLFENWPHDLERGLSAYMLAFEFDGDTYQVNWPVLPSRKGDTVAAKRQAATFVYHHVKALIKASQILGVRTVFAGHLRLSDGRTVGETPTPELARLLPALPAPSAPIVEIVE